MTAQRMILPVALIVAGPVLGTFGQSFSSVYTTSAFIVIGLCLFAAGVGLAIERSK